MILVTGGTGYVGSHLLPRLVARSEAVRCLVRSPQKAGVAERLGAEAVSGRVEDMASLRAAMGGVRAVIHLVAIIREWGQATFEAINHQGTANVVAAAVAAGVERLVHQSALGADPASPYAYLRSKGLGEEAVRRSGLAYTILRPSVIFGEGDEFFNKLAGLVKWNPMVPILGDGSTRFQPIWAEDVVTCLLRALDDEATIGRTYELGGPETLTYEELVDLVMEVLGRKRPKLHIPVALMRPIVALWDQLLRDPPVNLRQLELLPFDNVAQDSATQRVFGVTPKPVREGIGYVRSQAFFLSRPRT